MFTKAASATAAYEDAERAHSGDANVQVLLLAAESLDAVKVTHGNFFERFDVDALLDELKAAV